VVVGVWGDGVVCVCVRLRLLSPNRAVSRCCRKRFWCGISSFGWVVVLVILIGCGVSVAFPQVWVILAVISTLIDLGGRLDRHRGC